MEILRALGSLAEPPSEPKAHLAELLELGSAPEESRYSDLFLFQLYPYASVYLDAEGMLGGEARDRVAGFWRALGESPPAESDHLAVMLALQARLGDLEEEADAESEARERWRHARKAFLWEHLLSWLPPYLARIEEMAPPFYRRWGALLIAALEEEAAALGDSATRLPLHLRAAPPLEDPRAEGGEALLRSLLAPVRSGLILTRSDLSRASRATDAGTRIGERRFILEALLAQDAAGTLAWLAEEASRQAKRLRGIFPEPITAFWGDRAEGTARLLAELAGDALA